MSSQRKLRYCLAIGIALLGLPQPLFAQSTTELNQISEDPAQLANIGANDFFPNGQASSTVQRFEDFFQPLSFNPDTTRTVRWEMRVSKNDLKQPLEIEYELIADNNKPDQLNKKVSGPDPALPVTNIVRLKDQEEVEEECSSETEGDCDIVLVKGAAELIINISQFREAGEYKGKLLVCVKNNDDECI